MATLLGGDRWKDEEDDHGLFWREDYEEHEEKSMFFGCDDDEWEREEDD